MNSCLILSPKSGHFSKGNDREKCLDVGMDDYMGKPINIQELVAALEKCGQSQSTCY